MVLFGDEVFVRGKVREEEEVEVMVVFGLEEVEEVERMEN